MSSSHPPPKEPSGLFTRVTIGILAVTMLLVPLAIIALGRSLVPALDSLTALGRGSGPGPVTQTSEQATESGVRVRVMDAEGSPVAGASVHMVAPVAPFQELGAATTDRSGGCVFAEIPAPVVRFIAVRLPQGVVTSSPVAESERATPVDLTLSTADVIRGVVVDTADHPIGGALLSVEGMPWALDARATTDTDGTFTLVTVPHEASALTATANGWVPGSASLAVRQARADPGELSVRIQLKAGATIAGEVLDTDGNPVRARIIACEGEPNEVRSASKKDGTFELSPQIAGCSVIATDDAFAASDPVTAVSGGHLTLRLRPGGSIEGTVVDERGSGVPAFVIGVESFSAAKGASKHSGNQRKSFEDPGGAFRMDKLAPGTYVLTASAAGKPPTRSDPIDVTGGGATRGVKIVLAAGGVVSGHVYDDDHQPLGGVELSFDQVSSVVTSTAHARTDDTGAYTLEGAPSGPFTLRADKKGYRVRMLTGLVVAAGATLSEDVTLSPASGGTNMEFGGIGATLDQSSGGIVFRAVFPGDPADKAGLRANDVILAVDGESTETMSLSDVLQRLRGEAGTTVGITVKRGVPPETITAVVVRAVVVH